MSKSKSKKSGITKDQLRYIFRSNGWEETKKGTVFHYPKTSWNFYLKSTSLMLIRAIKNEKGEDDIQIKFDKKYKQLNFSVVRKVLEALDNDIKERVKKMEKKQEN